MHTDSVSFCTLGWQHFDVAMHAALRDALRLDPSHRVGSGKLSSGRYGITSKSHAWRDRITHCIRSEINMAA